jgi:hypothetical protein
LIDDEPLAELIATPGHARLAQEDAQPERGAGFFIYHREPRATTEKMFVMAPSFIQSVFR